VATAFEFQLHSVDPIMLGGGISFAFADAAAVLDFYFDYSARAPDELNMECALTKLPDGTRFVAFSICYSGPRAVGEKILAELSAVRKPIEVDVSFVPYVALQKSDDETLGVGKKYYVKSGFVQKPTPALRDAMIGVIADGKVPAVQSLMLVPSGGAIARVKPTDTAFAQRSAPMNILMVSIWDDPAMSAQAGEATRTAWKSIEPHTHGFYTNLNITDDAARIRETYGVNHERLVALKTRVDPRNLFRMNANVRPRQV
jgi:hypothetical protein